jgi:hypothetical protein
MAGGAKRGLAERGRAGRGRGKAGKARQGAAGPSGSLVRPGMSGLGLARLIKAGRALAGHVPSERGSARLGRARQAGHCSARPVLVLLGTSVQRLVLHGVAAQGRHCSA